MNAKAGRKIEGKGNKKGKEQNKVESVTESQQRSKAQGKKDETDEGGFWALEHEDTLISLYRDLPHLWNKTAPGYKTCNKLDIAHKAWAEKFGCTCVYKNIINTVKYNIIELE